MPPPHPQGHLFESHNRYTGQSSLFLCFLILTPMCQLVNFRFPHPLTVLVRLGSWWMLMGGYLCKQFSRLLRMSSGGENVRGLRVLAPRGTSVNINFPIPSVGASPGFTRTVFFSYWFMVSKIYLKFLWKGKIKNTPYFMFNLVLSVSVISNLL